MFEMFYLLNKDFKRNTHWNKRLHLLTIKLSLDLEFNHIFLKK